MTKIRVLAALNKCISTGTGTISFSADLPRSSFANMPVTTQELKMAFKGANVLEFKILTTIHGLQSQISQRPKWRSAEVVLVDGHTVEEAYGLHLPVDQPLELLNQIRKNRLAEGQHPRILIGLIPNDKVDADQIAFLERAGVDHVCTVEALETEIPKLLAARDE